MMLVHNIDFGYACLTYSQMINACVVVNLIKLDQGLLNMYLVGSQIHFG